MSKIRLIDNYDKAYQVSNKTKNKLDTKRRVIYNEKFIESFLK